MGATGKSEQSVVRPGKRRSFIGTCRRRWLLGPFAALALAPLGCSQLTLDPSHRTERGGSTPLRLPGTPLEPAFESGIAAVRQYFRSVQVLRQEGRIESALVEYDQKGGTGRFRDEALKYRNRMRRRATLWFNESGAGCIVRCQVRVQRLDTEDHRIFHRQREFNDVPNATPIDREAATRSEQNQVWTEMPRDSKLERELLQVLHNQVTAGAPPKRPS